MHDKGKDVGVKGWLIFILLPSDITLIEHSVHNGVTSIQCYFACMYIHCMRYMHDNAVYVYTCTALIACVYMVIAT